MGLFTKKRQHVQVQYHDLAHRPPETVDMTPSRYTFKWAAASFPTVGTWVWVDGIEGPTTGVVVAIAPAPEGIEPKYVIGVLSPADMEQFSKARAYNEWAKEDNKMLWLDMARHKAGFAPTREHPAQVPAPYDPIPATNGRVVGDAAKERGRIWWRLYNLAMEHDLPADEIARFKEIADGWYTRSRMKD